MVVKDYLASVIRTVTPMLVGVAIVWVAAKTGLSIPDEPTKTVVTGLVGGGYYAAVRAAEARWKWAGWLLGYAVAPSYAKSGGDVE